jgi:hypothetical protein
MTRDELQALFSKPPASFTWSRSEDGQRIIGASTGCVLDLWADRAEMVATFPPDDAALAQRNGTLMSLLLAAMRPDWSSANDWLAVQMRTAARSKQAYIDVPNITRRVTFKYDRQHSRATLVVKM